MPFISFYNKNPDLFIQYPEILELIIRKYIREDYVINIDTDTPEIIRTNPKIIEHYEEIFYYLSSGYTCIKIDGTEKIIAVETKTQLDRGIDESKSESIIRGPKDAFTENYMTNIGLIRKRIKDNNLLFEEIKLGRRTKTKLSISYIKDIVKEEKIKKIKNKLKKLDVDGILDSGPIRDYLTENLW